MTDKQILRRLDKYLKEHHLTLKDAAAFIGVCPETISRWRSGTVAMSEKNKRAIMLFTTDAPGQLSANLQRIVDYFKDPQNEVEMFEFLAKISKKKL